MKNTLYHCSRFAAAGRSLTGGALNLRAEARSLVFLLAFLATLTAGGLAAAGGLAEVTPDDALMYVEVNKPAELWAALQQTELRDAIRTSFYAELYVNFTGATADLLAKSLTNMSTTEALSQYGLEFVVAFSPKRAHPKTREFVVIVRPTENTTEFQTLIRERAEQTFASRFPEVKVSTERVGDRDVKQFAVSKRVSFSLALADTDVVFGHERAVRWFLEAKTFLSDKEGYREMRRRAHVPDTPNVFCYAEVTKAAGEDAHLYAPGTKVASVLEVEGKLIKDRTVVSDNLKLPELS